MKRLIVIVLAVVVFLGAGYFAASKVWGFPMFGVVSSKESKKEPEIKTSMVSLGQFMTNLVDHGRYIRVTVDLEIDSAKSADVTGKTSEFKTDVYALLRSKTYAELTGEGGLRTLQTEIKARLEAKSPGVILNVFFSEFIVQ